MTATTDRVDDEADPASPTGESGDQSALHRRPTDWLGNRVDVGCVALLMAFAAVLRLVHIGSAYDVFVDEFFYEGLAKSAGKGQIPPHMPPGFAANTSNVFLLHPPGFFVLLGIWQHITGTTGDVFHQLLLARGLNAVLGVLTVGLLFLLGRRLGGRWVGIAAALLFALDPYILRQNGRILLETATLFWVLAGYFVLVGLVQGRYRRPQHAAVAVGILFGCAILTKDTISIETAGAVLVLAVLDWGIPRRLAIRILGVAAAIYSTYVLACVYQGHGGQFWYQKTLGLRRQLGLVQTTGFNRPNSVSLGGALWSEFTSFALTYLLVALGAVGAVHLLRSRRDDYRVLGVFVASATAFMAYAIAFGTLEEQFLYFLAIPAILSVTTVSGEMWRKTTTPTGRTSVASIVLIAAIAATSLWNLGVWAHIRSARDDATQAAVSWLKQSLPTGTRIAVTNDTELYSMSTSGLRTSIVESPKIMATNHIRYIVLSSRNTAHGYSFVTPDSAAWFAKYSRTVFSFHSATQGDLVIYETTDSDLW